MIKKSKLKNIKQFSSVKLLLLTAIIFAVIAVIGLRNNYSTMTKLRTEVSVADEQNGDVEKALADLRKFVISHMNTNLTSGTSPIKPPIQLKYRYERLVAAQAEQIKAQNNKVAADAEVVCGQQYPGGGFNPPRVQCVQNYVAANSSDPTDIADDLYKFDFISPKWSPDLAGISIVIAILSFILAITVFAIKKYSNLL